jgi:two-component system, cell cycle sensor histidine kinase and response regulator CckA
LLRTTVTTASRPAVVEASELPELERERSRRVFRQLERQVLLNTGLAKRCSSLASELTVLTGIADAVLKQRDVDAALDDALAACFDAGGISVGALYLVDDNGEMRVRTLANDGNAWDVKGLPTFFGHEALLREVMTTRTPLYAPSSEVGDAVSGHLLAATGGSGVLVVPLASPQRALGALLMVSRGRELDVHDWRVFALGVASQISQVLTLARAYSDAEAAERKATRQAALLEAVFESAPDFVIHLDREGLIRFINRLEPPRRIEDMLGTRWIDYLPLAERPKVQAAFESANIGITSDFEIQTTLQGAPRFYNCRLGPVREHGTITGFVTVARDVTDRKHTEMQLMLADRMASVGTLAAGVAHEINNPLAAVIANLDMAVQDVAALGDRPDLPPDLVDELADARAAADRVREIVRDLKLFSRTHEDTFGAVNVEKVLDSTLRMAWNEIRHRAKLVKEYGTVPRVVANESRLGQVLLNVIVNAVQAIPEGKYEDNEIRISTQSAEQHVEITITDTGMGMPPEVKQRLFTPFFTTKPVGVGTGLGLAISHRIITAMGGTITFDSDLGKGTVFRIRLPIAGPGTPVLTAKIPIASAATRRGRVLVIDDEETIGNAICRYLARDHDVEAVVSARHAIDMLARGERYDVVLCDLMMPQITGIEFYGTVAKLDVAQATRIAFMTGGAFTEAARAFFEETPNPRIEKPFDLKSLLHFVNQLIQ